MFDFGILVVGILVLAHLPAVLLPVPSANTTRRDGIALSAAVVLVFLAVVVTIFSGYGIFFLPPLFAWCLSASLVGLAGKNARWYGVAASAAYAAILTALALSWGFNPLFVVAYAAVMVLCGGVGGLTVELVWLVRGIGNRG